MQHSFYTLNEIFSHFLLIIDPLDDLLSKTARKIYQELIKTSLKDEGEKFLVAYKQLETNLSYCPNTIRKGLLELERENLIIRTKTLDTNSFFVKLNRGFFTNNFES